jgi:SAM-dependent methyltransferase
MNHGDVGRPLVSVGADPIREAVTAELARLTFRSGFVGLEQTVRRVIEATGATSLLEVGAGRNPALWKLATELGMTYVANDIDPHELRTAGGDMTRIAFDIGGALPDIDRVDLIVSRSVLEHVRNVDRAIENSALLLRPGGFALHFAPTLYSLPFVVNRIMPETLALRVLRVVRPRDESRKPKFPAYYHRCRSTRRNIDHLNGLCSEAVVDVIPYFGHRYYERIPILGRMAPAIHGWLAARDVRLLSSFAWIVVHRPG